MTKFTVAHVSWCCQNLDKNSVKVAVMSHCWSTFDVPQELLLKQEILIFHLSVQGFGPPNTIKKLSVSSISRWPTDRTHVVKEVLLINSKLPVTNVAAGLWRGLCPIFPDFLETGIKALPITYLFITNYYQFMLLWRWNLSYLAAQKEPVKMHFHGEFTRNFYQISMHCAGF